MRNIWLIVRQDISHLFSNVMSTIIMVGLVVLPSLFAWYNTLACWNVFENTGNLTIAVANEDDGYESDLIPISINVGERVVAGLHENDQIDWVFTTEDDAIDGTKSGKYYAAVVIPDSFSKDMLTFYQKDYEHASIDYYVNEKKNAIAPRITGMGADAVSYEINEVFAQTISEVALKLSQTLSKYADEDDVNGRVAVLSDHLRHVSDRMDQTAEVLRLYSSLAVESQGLVASSADLIDAAKTQADWTMTIVDGSEQSLYELSDAITASAYDLSASMELSDATMADLQNSADSLMANASADAQTAAASLREVASKVDERVTECSDIIATLEELRALVPLEHTPILDAAIASLSDTLRILQDTRDALLRAADDLESGDADAQAAAEYLRQQAEQAKVDIDAVKANVEQNLTPGLDQLAVDIQALTYDLDQGAANLDALGGDLSDTVDAAGGALGEAAGKVDDAAADLEGVAQSFRDLADAIEAALNTGDEETLRTLLQGDASDLASALSAPVQIDRTAIFPCQDFGSAMAPLYSTLALFVGSLLIMVVTKPQVSKRGREKLRNPKPRHLYFGRYGVVAFISLMQSTLMGLGNMLFLQVQVNNPMLFMACYWISGLIFAFIVYTLVVAFENLGKGIAVLMLIIQVTACGGSYPLQLMPGFVQFLSPFVPATHVVNAMRAAMMGVYQNDFWISMGELACFLVPALLLGLVLRKPMERFMRFYISKVEDCQLME